MSKERAKLDVWMKEIAPSEELRQWFGHEPEKWQEFKKRYAKELALKQSLIDQIKQFEKEKDVITLVFSARDIEHNNAVVVKIQLEKE
jgi:uncharacterized protein YeaO (DUF488 family)